MVLSFLSSDALAVVLAGEDRPFAVLAIGTIPSAACILPCSALVQHRSARDHDIFAGTDLEN